MKKDTYAKEYVDRILSATCGYDNGDKDALLKIVNRVYEDGFTDGSNMSNEVKGALRRIIEEVEQKRKADCLMKDCIINDMIGGNDIQMAQDWLSEQT